MTTGCYWLVLVAACGGSTAAVPDAPPGVAISQCSVDVHQHFAGNVDFAAAAPAMLATMDALGIRTALVMPPPQEALSVGTPGGAHYDYLDASAGGGPSLSDLVRDNPDRFALVAGGGLLNPLIHEAVLAGQPVSDSQLDQLEDMAKTILADGAKGFGELAVLHLSFLETHAFMSIPADHPMVLRLASVAAEHGVPLDIHLEAVERATVAVPDEFLPTTPMGGHCFMGPNNNPDAVTNNIAGFERLLDHSYQAACATGDCDRARIVWSHVGWDNVGDLDVDLVARLIADHPNLYPSLKLLDQPSFCQLADNRPLADLDGDAAYDTIQANWSALIAANPQRFVLGSDEFFGDGIGAPSTNGTWAVLGYLDPDTQRAIACDNPCRLYNLR